MMYMLVCVAGLLLHVQGKQPVRVRLSSIETLTLYAGRYTEGRRSSPVPQLKCIGGTAGCSAFVPKVVQCYNRGSDGSDIQWECKTDMDNAYRFGEISVSCEGFDYPEDDYILQGSCGLEYQLDLTKEGYQQQQGQGHQYYDSSHSKEQQHYDTSHKRNKLSSGSWLALLAVIAVVYMCYRTCFAGNNYVAQPTADAPPPYSSIHTDGAAYTAGPAYTAPYPPPNNSYQAPPPPYPSAQPKTYHHHTNQSANAGPGFWTGAATGGAAGSVLGYLFGSSRNNPNAAQYQTPYRQAQPRGSSWGTGWGSGSSSATPAPAPAPASTGTRTASGFGGTRRR